MSRPLLLRAQHALKLTPSSFPHSGAPNLTSTARAFLSARSSSDESISVTLYPLEVQEPTKFKVFTSDQPNRLPSSSKASQPWDEPVQLYDPRAEDVIRATNQLHNRTRWGFVTCRCTYKSQTRWDEFMSRIREDARERLKDDPDLFESMDWPVIEDPKLDGVHYSVAARRFGDWAKSSLSEEAGSGTPLPTLSEVNGPDGWSPGLDPRHGAFIYANEDVVNSVVDHLRGEDKSRGKGYFVYLVNYDGVREWDRNNEEIIAMLARREAGQGQPGDDQIARGWEDVVDLEKEDTDLDDHSDNWRELRVKLRACYLVSGYATVEDEQGWDYGFEDSSENIHEPVLF